MKKNAVVAAALVLLLASCSGSEEPAADDPAPAATDAEAGEAPTRKELREERERKERRHRRHRGHRRRSSSADPDQPFALEEAPTEDDGSSAAYPAAGMYTYRQSGAERFCQAAACSREPLPPREEVRIELRSPTNSRAVVVSEAGSSEDRILRTTATYTSDQVLVTNVYSKLVYEGFTFERSYQPDPPVVSLRFPLEEGDSWSGRWSDRTSGTYSMTVLGREAMGVNGASVGAVKVSAVMTFSGELEGEAKSLLWIDPATKATVRTSGTAEFTSSYGRYEVEFTNRLLSGPGY